MATLGGVGVVVSEYSGLRMPSILGYQDLDKDTATVRTDNDEQTHWLYTFSVWYG